MPTIHAEGGYDFRFRSADRDEPPHVHVEGHGVDFGTAIRWPDIDEDIGVATLLGVPEWLVEQTAGFEIHDLR